MAIAMLALATQLSAAGTEPVIQVDFSNNGGAPSQWTMTLRPDGTGHFRSQKGKAPVDQPVAMDTPGVDRDFQLTASYAARVFDEAERRKWFNEPCESHMKVAFQGWKTFTYTGPQGSGACTFNYSKDKDLQGLAESFEAVAQTLLEGARLEMLLQHDRLGLDAEMEFLTQAAADGRVQQISAIREILERLTQDDQVLERVRKRARALLDHEIR